MPEDIRGGDIYSALKLDLTDFSQKIRQATAEADKLFGKMHAESAGVAQRTSKNVQSIASKHTSALSKWQKMNAANLAQIDVGTKKVFNAATKASKDFVVASEAHAEKMGRSWWERFGKVALGFSVAYTALRLVEFTLRQIVQESYKSVEALDEFKKAAIATSAIVVSMAQVKDPYSAYTKVLPEMTKMMQYLDIVAAKHLVTSEELREAYSAWVKKGVLAGPEDVENLATIADLISFIAEKNSKSYQMMQEIYGLYEGVTGRGRQLAYAVSALHPELKKFIDGLKEAGVDIENHNVLLKEIANTFPGLQAAQKSIYELWSTQLNTVKSYYDVIKRIAVADVYKEAVGDLTAFNESLMKSGQFTQKLLDLAYLWKGALSLVYETFKLLLVPFSVILDNAEDLGTLLGIVAMQVRTLRESLEIVAKTLSIIPANIVLRYLGKLLGVSKNISESAAFNAKMWNEFRKALARVVSDRSLEKMSNDVKVLTFELGQVQGLTRLIEDGTIKAWDTKAIKEYNGAMKNTVAWYKETAIAGTSLDAARPWLLALEELRKAQAAQAELIATGQRKKNIEMLEHEISLYSTFIQDISAGLINIHDTDQVENYTGEMQNVLEMYKKIELEGVPEKEAEAWFKVAETLRKIKVIQEGFLEGAQKSGTYFEGLKKGFDDFDTNMKTAFEYGQDMAEATSKSMADSFSTFFLDATKGELKDWSDYVMSVLNSIMREYTSMLGDVMALIVRRGATAAWSYATATETTAANVAHSGGVAGRDAFPKRDVPIRMFDFAPRLHNGLKPGEFPAILEVGERVTAKGESDRSDVVVNIINKGAPLEEEGTTQRFDAERTILDVVVRGIQTKPTFRRTIRGA